MPSPAGYSGTPLAKKLGLKPGPAVFLGAPPHLGALLAPLPEGVEIRSALGDAPHGYVHLFATERAALGAELPRLLAALADDGMIWVSWPKKASKVPTDITEDTVRAIALPLGLVDVKVCAVDAVWSGLKLVLRKALRGTARP